MQGAAFPFSTEQQYSNTLVLTQILKRVFYVESVHVNRHFGCRCRLSRHVKTDSLCLVSLVRVQQREMDVCFFRKHSFEYPKGHVKHAHTLTWPLLVKVVLSNRK